MKKIKVVGIIVLILVLLIVIDIICIYTLNRPLFGIQNDGGNVYRGLIYDTYNCAEYSAPQIKFKGTKFSCADVKISNFQIIDKTYEMPSYICAEALESFYKDNKYTYYWNCMKDKYVVVKYEDGTEEKVSEALSSNKITTDDLDRFNISYIKYRR